MGLKNLFTNATKKTRDGIHRPASQEEVTALTIMSFGIAMVQIINPLLNIYQWATVNPSFDAYFLWTPFIGLVAWVLYMYVLFMKNVYSISWLPFIPGVVGIIYSFLLMIFRFGLASPTFLKFW